VLFCFIRLFPQFPSLRSSQKKGRACIRHFNRKYGQRGYLYQGRYKAVLVQTGVYLTRLIRYIHLNPVRANLVNLPHEYHWSSHLAYAEQSNFTWLCKDLILASFAESPAMAKEKLLQYMNISDEEAKEELFEIRKSSQIGAYGDEVFLSHLHKELDEDRPPKYSFSLDHLSVEDIIEAVCNDQKISLDDIQSDKRDKRLVLARAAMAFITKQQEIDSLSNLGRLIKRDPTALAKLIRKAKDDPYLKALCERVYESLLASYA